MGTPDSWSSTSCCISFLVRLLRGWRVLIRSVSWPKIESKTWTEGSSRRSLASVSASGSFWGRKKDGCHAVDDVVGCRKSELSSTMVIPTCDRDKESTHLHKVVVIRYLWWDARSRSKGGNYLVMVSFIFSTST